MFPSGNGRNFKGENNVKKFDAAIRTDINMFRAAGRGRGLCEGLGGDDERHPQITVTREDKCVRVQDDQVEGVQFVGGFLSVSVVQRASAFNVKA